MIKLFKKETELGVLRLLKHPQVEIFHHTRWNPVGTGEDVWQSFAANGSLPNYIDETPADENTQV